MENNVDESEKSEVGPLRIGKHLKRNLNDEFSVFDGVFPIANFETDTGDIPDSKAIVSCWDIFWICISILTHLIDMVTDINLASQYLKNEQIGYFIWTFVFLMIPSIINLMISIRMYNQDREINLESEKKSTFSNKITHNIIFWPLIVATQFAPVLRYIDTLTFAIKSYISRKNGNQENKKKYYLKMLKEEQDIALMRILECFLEAAPHQILQFTIILMENHNVSTVNPTLIHQCVSMLSSLIGMGWAMSSYHRSIRKAQWDMENISKIGNWLQFLWHFFITVSRVVSITAVATISPLYVGIVAIVHWFVMTAWILTKPAGIMEFCRDRRKPPHISPNIWERSNCYLLSAIFGVIYVFTYLKPNDGPTYWKHMFYYSICGIENLAAALIWSLFEHSGRSQWYYLTIALLCTVPFVLGIIIMIIYYKFFHPNGKKISNSIIQIDNNVNYPA